MDRKKRQVREVCGGCLEDNRRKFAGFGLLRAAARQGWTFGSCIATDNITSNNLFCNNQNTI